MQTRPKGQGRGRSQGDTFSRTSVGDRVSYLKIRRLFWDIENSPLTIFSWRVGKKIDVTHDNIVKERAIISIAWKWEGEQEVYSLHWDRDQSDKKMIQRFAKELAKADEVVAHWGDGHDAPWIRTRALYHGLRIPPFKTVDTCKMAMNKMAFASCKLDYLAKFLGIGQKLDTGFGLWKQVVLRNCPKAMKQMCEYNRTDVVLLEKVWRRLSEICEPLTHVGVLNGGEKYTCPKCGSEDVRTNKTAVTAGGVKQFRMQCKCGSYFSISQSVHNKYLKR